MGRGRLEAPRNTSLEGLVGSPRPPGSQPFPAHVARKELPALTSTGGVRRYRLADTPPGPAASFPTSWQSASGRDSELILPAH